MQDTNEEVLIAVLACMALFLILAGIILLFLFLYRRRKAVQQREVELLEQQFKEQSLRAQLEIQENTFRAISQEIHDNVGQMLSLARIQVNIITEKQVLDEELLQNVKDNIGKALADLRDLAGSMNGERIRMRPIHEPLTLELERINRLGILDCALVVEGEQHELDAARKLILFRIVQEGIQNCIKHAGAAHLILRVCYREENVEVELADDGKGFDQAMMNSGKGIGLLNMQTRVRLTGGSCVIESAPDRGSTIKLTIPYE